MTDKNWTPGPWAAEGNEADGIKWVDSPHGESICDLYHSTRNVETGRFTFHKKVNADANANLIAAATELYEALEMVKQAHIMDICGGFLNHKELHQINSALKKARGEQ